MHSYVDKLPTLALLILGGLSNEELLKMPKVTINDVESAKKLLAQRGFSVGRCQRCNEIAWLSQVKWEIEGVAFSAELCMMCAEFVNPKKARI